MIRPLVLRDPSEMHRASTWLELFFDLCFVIAVSALARGLHHDPNAWGMARFMGLLVPVWWAWMGFTWYSSGFDNDDALHRMGLLGAGLGIVWLAASVSGVEHGFSTSFILAYAAVMLVLIGLFARAWRAGGPASPWALRSVTGNGLGLAVWLVSLAVPEPPRYVVWMAAMVMFLATPILAVRSLTVGTAYRAVVFHPGHIRERYGLFTIIVLGESLLAVAAGTAGADWSAAGVLAGFTGFVIAAGVWWLYFGHVRSDALVLGARTAFYWGYGHLFIYAGIAAIGVGVQLTIESTLVPAGDVVDAAARFVLGSGATLFLLAMAFTGWSSGSGWDVSVARRTVAAVAAMVLAAAAAMLAAPAACFAAGVAAVVVVLTMSEERTV